MNDIYFWRQFFILVASFFSMTNLGFLLAYPSVLNPGITSPNSTDIKTTSDHASWISSINGIGGAFGAFLISPIMDVLGRKACCINMNVFCLIGWIIFFFAENVTSLYVARFIQGIGNIGVYVSLFVFCEYVNPSRRGYFVTLKIVATTLGVLICHSLNDSLTWRQMTIIPGLLTFISIIMTFFWPESPSFLALKGKFAECERSFKWIYGNSEKSQKELKSLIDAQQERMARNEISNYNFINLAKKVLEKNFQKPFLITSMLVLAVEFSGRHFQMGYIIKILKELMDNKTSALYLTIGIDLLALTAVSISSVVINYTKRRTMLLYSGVASVLLMLLVSILAYLNSTYTLSRSFQWFTAVMTVLQSYIVTVGMVPVTSTQLGEIFPLEHKAFGSFSTSLVFTIMLAVILKTAPVLMETINIYGTYSIFGVAQAVCMVVLYKTVPETKDKTLQEIEDELNGFIRTDNIVIEKEKLMH